LEPPSSGSEGRLSSLRPGATAWLG